MLKHLERHWANRYARFIRSHYYSSLRKTENQQRGRSLRAESTGMQFIMYVPLSWCSHLEFLQSDINVTKPRLEEQTSLVPNCKMTISMHYCYSIQEHDQNGGSMIKLYQSSYSTLILIKEVVKYYMYKALLLYLKCVYVLASLLWHQTLALPALLVHL